MAKLKKYWLNEWGERYWYKKSDITIVAHRAYNWVDRITYINEGSVSWIDGYGWSTGDRLHIIGSSDTYTEFKNNEIDDWVPIEDYQEYSAMLKLEYDARKYKL